MQEPADDLTKLIDSIAKTRAATLDLKMAEVVYLEEGAARLRFIGDATPTPKLFKTLGALAEAGDFVVTAPVGGSQVILGKLGGIGGGPGVGGSCGCYHVGPRSTYTTINAAVRAAVADTPDGGAAAICIHDKGSPYQEVVVLSDEPWPAAPAHVILLPRDIHLYFQGHGSQRPVWNTDWTGSEPSGWWAVSYGAFDTQGRLRTVSFEDIKFTGVYGAVDNWDLVGGKTGSTCIARNCQWVGPDVYHPNWTFVNWYLQGSDHVYIEDCEFWGNGHGWLANVVQFGPGGDDPVDDMLLVFRRNTLYQLGQAGGDLSFTAGPGSKAWIYDNRIIEGRSYGWDIGDGWGIDVHDNDVIDCDDDFVLIIPGYDCTATGYVGPNSFRGSPGATPQWEERAAALLTVSRVLQGPLSKRPAMPPPDVRLYQDTDSPALWWWNEAAWVSIS